MGYIGVITHLLLTNHLLTSWDIRPCWWYPSSTKPVESEETQKLVELQNEKNPPALTKKNLNNPGSPKTKYHLNGFSGSCKGW